MIHIGRERRNNIFQACFALVISESGRGHGWMGGAVPSCGCWCEVT